MTSTRVAAVAVCTLVALAASRPAAAQTTTMDFSALGLPNKAAVGSTYGSQTHLDVTSATVDGFGDADLADCGPGNVGARVTLWTGAGSAPAAFACRDASVSQYHFAPDAGFRVFLSSLVLASPLGGLARDYTIRVYDALDWSTPLFSTIGQLAVPTSFDVNVSSANGLYLQIGSSRNVGVARVTTTVSPLPAVAVTAPEPVTLLLLGPGLLAIAVARRRRAHA